jgi:hypothetical protein
MMPMKTFFIGGHFQNAGHSVGAWREPAERSGFRLRELAEFPRSSRLETIKQGYSEECGMAIKTAARSNGSDWYRIRLSRDEYEGGEVGVIQGAFQQIYIASNAPKGMAMLGSKDDDSEGYCVYFTPPSLPHVRALLKAYSAVPHAPPARRDLALIFGNPPDSTLATREF